MNTTLLNVKLPQPEAIKYQVNIGTELIKKIPSLLGTLTPVARYIIITDTMMNNIYGTAIINIFKKADLQADIITFPAGEKNKTEATHRKLTHKMLQKKCGRDTMIIALGGGVVGDTAGYVAATYMRGIPYINIPTSFLAMVDSSIGGKVGVDTKFGKNLIGAFWHPEAVIVDIDYLKKLPQTQLVNGLMESIKIFLTYNKEMLEMVENNWKKVLKKDLSLLQKIIARSIELKIGVVTRDEHEANERMVVNWGHTIGHAIEHLSNFSFGHGYCVGYGILVESKIAELMGVLSIEDFEKVCEMMHGFGITKKALKDILKKFSIQAIVKQTLIDKKARNGKVKYVLLEKIGSVKTTKGMFGHEIDKNMVKKALTYFTK